ncbi:MAG: urea ABC transporter permease subunit UrtB [Bacteroidota bacterium]
MAVRPKLLVVMLAIALGLIWQALHPAMAAPLDDALGRLAADSFRETEKAISEIASSGAPTAEVVLTALSDRRLFLSSSDKSIYFKDQAGNLFDATTGQPAKPAESGLSLVRINNRLRGQIEAALGSLTLMSPDLAKRLAAAESVFKSRDEKSLAAIETALAREKDARVKSALSAARAAVLLAKPDAALTTKVEAIALLAERADQEALGLLRAASSAGSPELKVAADVAIVTVERRLSVIATLQNVWYGLSLGSVLLLAAIGLAITFGVMGVINMAHGEMVMLGAYTTFVVQEALRTMAPAWFDWSLPIAIPLAFLVAALVGVVIERGVIRFLYGRPLETLLATWGVSLILQQAVRTAFGPTNREVGNPSYMSGAFDVLGLSITYGRLWIILSTLLVFFALLLALKATPLGLQMRAVTQNRRMASSMGIPTGRIDAMTFALGSGIAGIAGVALSQIDNVSPNLGQNYIIDSFMVVVFGGVGNLWGTFFGAFALGVANKFLEPFAGAVLGKIMILVLLILFIQRRPRGMFALKGRAVEA